MTRKEFCEEIQINGRDTIIALGFLLTTICMGVKSFFLWIWENIIAFARKHTGLTFVIILVVYIVSMSAQMIIYKQKELQSSARIDALIKERDSIQIYSTYECGFAAGVESATPKIGYYEAEK